MVEYSSLRETLVLPSLTHKKHHGIANRKDSETGRLGRELKIINFWHNTTISNLNSRHLVAFCAGVTEDQACYQKIQNQ